MSIEEIKEKIRLLELDWKKETNNDKLTYLNGQLSAWHEMLRNCEKQKEKK
jgi:hypothetical protein